MDILFEQKLIQNSALSTQILYTVICEFYKTRDSGMPFPLAFIVTPLLFQKKFVDAFYNKKGKGMLFRITLENQELLMGLQTRMESSFNQTMVAISLGIKSDLFSLSAGIFSPISIRKIEIPDSLSPMFSSARRLGKSFSESNIEEISQFLKVVF